MDEEYINDIYSEMGGEETFGSFEDFKSLITTDDEYANDVYTELGGEDVFGAYEDYRKLTKASEQALVEQAPIEKKKDSSEGSSTPSWTDSKSTKPQTNVFSGSPIQSIVSGEEIPEEIKTSQPSPSYVDRKVNSRAEEIKKEMDMEGLSTSKKYEALKPKIDSIDAKMQSYGSEYFNEIEIDFNARKANIENIQVDMQSKFPSFYDENTGTFSKQIQGKDGIISMSPEEEARFDELNELYKVESEALKEAADKYTTSVRNIRELQSQKVAAKMILKEDGSWIGSLWTGLTADGIPEIAAGAAKMAIDQNTLYPDVVKKVINKEIDRQAEEVSNFLLENVSLPTGGSTREYAEGRFIPTAMQGLGASIPAMLTTAMTGGATMFAMNYNAADKLVSEIPDSDLSNNEKVVFKIALAGTVSALENFGFSNLVKNTPVLKAIIAKSFNSGGDDMLRAGLNREFIDLVLNEANNATAVLNKLKAKGAFIGERFVTGGLSEFETGYLQGVAEDVFQQSVNAMKGKEVFESKGIKDIAIDNIEDGLMEAFGGGVMGLVMGVFANPNSTNKHYEAATMALSAISLKDIGANLDALVLEGKMDADRAKEIYSKVESYKSVLDKVPEDFSDADKVEAVRLISLRNGLMAKMEGKDEAFSEPIKKNIDAINAKLSQMVMASATEESVAEEVAAEEAVAEEVAAEEAETERRRQEIESYFNDNTRSTEDTKYNPDLSGEGELALREQEEQLLQLGADRIQAHGIAKGSIGQQFKDLLNILTKGLDKRGGGQLYTAPLVMPENMRAGTGAALGTGGGTAYIDGGFIILARAGVNEIRSIDDIGGVLVNQAIADSLPELVNKLKQLFPNLSIDSYSNSPNVISEINAKVESKEPVIVETPNLDGVSSRATKGELINESEIETAVNEAYDALDSIEKDNSISEQDKAILTELYEDEIQRLENYDKTTTTETRKVAEEKTVRTVKKTPRKTIPSREKDFVGKTAKYRDNKGGGQSGKIAIVETPDGKEYYVLESAGKKEVVGFKEEADGKVILKDGKPVRKVATMDSSRHKVILGETKNVFSDAVVNFDAKGSPVSVTFPSKSGSQVTVFDPEIAMEFEIEKAKNIEKAKKTEYDEQVFEEIYIEFVAEEKVEVLKPKTQSSTKEKVADESKSTKEGAVTLNDLKAALKAAIGDNQGIVFDPKSRAAADVALTNLIIKYIKQEGIKTAKALTDWLKKNLSLEISNQGADYLIGKAYGSKNLTPDLQPKTTKAGSVGVEGDETFYTGRGKKYEDLKNTKAEFIFFSKDPKISEWYGGDESNVSEAKLDASNFLDLTTQESKSKFVKENFTDKDIENLYSDEIKYEKNTDRFGKKTRESLIKKYRERAEENRFSGDGKEQQFLLKKIKEQGYGGVKLLDTHFGKSDVSYVVIDKSKIQQSLKETTKGESNQLGQKQQAQQLYSQYLDSLNKPNTNPILQGNQEEQVKKFAELQERLNNKEFIEGAKNAYESSKGLQEWGTQEQYNDYIARVSLGIVKNPSSGGYNYTSQVKDIVYHGSKNKFNKFNTEISEKKYENNIGIYFGDSNSYYNYGEKGYVYPSILNVKNPYYIHLNEPGLSSLDTSKSLEENYKVTNKDGFIQVGHSNMTNKLTREQFESLVEKKYFELKEELKKINSSIEDLTTASKEKFNNIISKIPLSILGITELAISNTEQIHILGSKQDVEGFKEFVSKNETKQPVQKKPVNTVREQAKKASEPTEKEVKAGEKAGVSPKNLRELYKLNRDMWGLDRVKAFASAIAMDRMIGAMAKRAVKYIDSKGNEKISPLSRIGSNGIVYVNEGTAGSPVIKEVKNPISMGVSKQEMYATIEFRKGDENTFQDLSARGKALFQIVGENANLSQTIKDNLGVAREMEEAGKDAKTIRIATGWEKGKDGKWRYEVEDPLIDLKEFAFDKKTTSEFSINGVYPKNRIIQKILENYDRKLNKKFDDRNEWLRYIDNSTKYSDKEVEGAKVFIGSLMDREVVNPTRNIEEIKTKKSLNVKLFDIVSEDLIELYPILSDINVSINLRKEGTPSLSVTGSFSDSQSEIKIDTPVYSNEVSFEKILSDNEIEIKSTLLHEIQHAIQDIEGFAKGGSPMGVQADISLAITMLKDDLYLAQKEFRPVENNKSEFSENFYNQKKKQVDDLKDKIQKLEDIRYDESLTTSDKYKALAGEVEARNVEARMGMTPEQRRATTLKETEDVARDEQIVLFNGTQAMQDGVRFQNAQGAMLMQDGKAIVYALTDPNISTPLHELAHVFEHYLSDQERTSVLKWANETSWNRDVSEKFARGYEGFLANGKAPTASMQKIFDRFKEWLTDIYNGITGSEIDVRLNKPMRNIYSSMLGKNLVTMNELKKAAIKSFGSNRNEKTFDPKDESTKSFRKELLKYVKALKITEPQAVIDLLKNEFTLEISKEDAKYIIDESTNKKRRAEEESVLKEVNAITSSNNSPLSFIGVINEKTISLFSQSELESLSKFIDKFNQSGNTFGIGAVQAMVEGRVSASETDLRAKKAVTKTEGALTPSTTGFMGIFNNIKDSLRFARESGVATLEFGLTKVGDLTNKYTAHFKKAIESMKVDLTHNTQSEALLIAMIEQELIRNESNLQSTYSDAEIIDMVIKNFKQDMAYLISQNMYKDYTEMMSKNIERFEGMETLAEVLDAASKDSKNLVKILKESNAIDIDARKAMAHQNGVSFKERQDHISIRRKGISKEPREVSIDELANDQDGLSIVQIFESTPLRTHESNYTLERSKDFVSHEYGVYYDPQFVSGQIESFNSVNKAIYTRDGVIKVNSFLRNPKSKDIFRGRLKDSQGMSNENYFKEGLNRSMNQDVIEKQSRQELRDIKLAWGRLPAGKILTSLTGFWRDKGLMLAMGTVTQPIRQAVAIASSSVNIVAMGRADVALAIPNKVRQLLDKKGDYLPLFLKIMEDWSVSLRDNVESVGISSDRFLSIKKPKFIGGFQRASKKGFDVSTNLLMRNPDRMIAQATWLSYYQSYMMNNNLDVTADYSSEAWWKGQASSPNKEAGDFANAMTKKDQNINAPFERSWAQSTDIKGRGSATRAIIKSLFPLMGFTFNKKGSIVADLNRAVARDIKGKDRAMAAAMLGGSVFEVATYSYLTIILIPYCTAILKDVIKSAFGDDDFEDEMTYMETHRSKMQDFKTKSFQDLFWFTGNLGFIDTAFNEGVNRSWYQLFADKKMYPTYETYAGSGGTPLRSFSFKGDWFDNLGIGGIVMETMNNSYKFVSAAANGYMETPNGQYVYFSDQQRETLLFMGAMQALGVLGIPYTQMISADLKNTSGGIARAIQREGFLENKLLAEYVSKRDAKEVAGDLAIEVEQNFIEDPEVIEYKERIIKSAKERGEPIPEITWTEVLSKNITGIVDYQRKLAVYYNLKDDNATKPSGDKPPRMKMDSFHNGVVIRGGALNEMGYTLGRKVMLSSSFKERVEKAKYYEALNIIEGESNHLDADAVNRYMYEFIAKEEENK